MNAKRRKSQKHTASAAWTDRRQLAAGLVVGVILVALQELRDG